VDRSNAATMRPFGSTAAFGYTEQLPRPFRQAAELGNW
jgi:hypothetical protein